MSDATISPSYGFNVMNTQELARPNKIRRITINQFDHGYMVEVGCQSMAIEDKAKLIDLLTQYITDPNAIEEKYNKGTLFQKPTE